MKVMLLMPPYENIIKYFNGWQLSASDYGAFPPLGLLYIATYLKQKMSDIEVKVVDCPSQKMDYAELEKTIRTFKPDAVGISVFTLCLVDVLKTAKLIKSIDNKIHICAGGPHLNIYPEQTLNYPQIDSIVIGEGENVFSDLIAQLHKGGSRRQVDGLYTKSDLNKNNFKKATVENIDSLPIFDINLIQREFYYSAVSKSHNIITLLSSRGCPYNCIFCDVPYKTFRGRTINNIIEEIKLRLKQGFSEIFFYDDTFNFNEQRVVDLCNKIIEEKLKFDWSFRGRVNTVSYEMLKKAKEAGCKRIHFGIETGTDEGLKQLKKGITLEQIKNAITWCRKLKIRTIADFIIGLPFEKSKEDVVLNIQRLVKLSPDYAQFNVLQPVPGSEIFEMGVREEIIDRKKWADFIDMPYRDFKPPLWNRYLESDDLRDLFHFAYSSFYFNPKNICRTLLSIKSRHELGRVINGGLKILLKK